MKMSNIKANTKL